MKQWSAFVAQRGERTRIISVRRSCKDEVAHMKVDIKAKELDKRFDAGADISKTLDLSRAKRPNQKARRVNVDFPTWMIHSLDKEADRLGVTRQSIIKIWISERLTAKAP
jgi:hypothetical protein